jgi:hypothetical protein
MCREIGMNWKLCRDARGRPQIDSMRDERQLWGVSLLAELARTDPSMHRLSDGVYEVSKLPGRYA